MPPQLIALIASISYALSNITARRGLRYSTPITVTCISLVVHTVTLWAAVFLTGGIPQVSLIALLLFVIAGILQPIIRLFTYMGIYHIGASRSGTLRSIHPLFSAIIAITILGEEAGITVIAGTFMIVIGIIMISWQREGWPSSFLWWHLLIPLAAALLAGIVHPIRRYALAISNHPLFFAALVGIVSLICLGGYLSLPGNTQRPVWDRRALWPFLTAGLFETTGILLVITALSLGPVVVVSPIVATSPMWILLGTVIFLRGIERVTARTTLGTCCVMGGTIAISLGG